MNLVPSRTGDSVCYQYMLLFGGQGNGTRLENGSDDDAIIYLRPRCRVLPMPLTLDFLFYTMKRYVNIDQVPKSSRKTGRSTPFGRMKRFEVPNMKYRSVVVCKWMLISQGNSQSEVCRSCFVFSISSRLSKKTLSGK